mgnify:CR=1 FL=1
MAQKDRGRKIYKSAKGKNVDLDLLIQRNELTPAVGNVRVNARGDELGPGGKIIKKREDVLSNYYSQTKNMKDESLSSNEQKQFEEFDSEPESEKDTVIEDQDEWIEDEDGNFIKKGDE